MELLLVAFLSSTFKARAVEFYPKDVPHDVRILNPASFDNIVKARIDSKGGRCFHIVKFYSSTGDVNLDPHFSRSVKLRDVIINLARDMRSTAAEVSVMDWENKANRALFRDEGIRRRQSLPVVKIFSPDNSTEVYTGSYNELASYVRKKVRSFVMRSKSHLLPSLINEKKRYVDFSDDDSLARVVFAYESKRGGELREKGEHTAAALALYFEGKINFATTKDKAVTRILSKGSTQLPAFFLIPPSEPLEKSIAYPGHVSYQVLRAWLQQFTGNHEVSTRLMLLDGINAMNYIPQVEGHGCLETLCVIRGGICVLNMIPRRATPMAEFNYKIESIRLAKRVLTNRIGVVAVNAVHFTWLDSNLYSNWIYTMFGLSDVEYSRTIAWWPTKKVWAPFVKAFDPLEIASWLESATQGTLRPKPEPVLSSTTANFSTDDPEAYPGDKVCLWMRYGQAPDQFVTDDFHKKLEVQKSTNFWEREEEDDDPDAPGVKKSSSRQPRPKSKWGVSYVLTAANFADNVLDTHSHWLVWFQSDNKQEKHDAWEKAAKVLKGKVQFGMVPQRERAHEILSVMGLEEEIPENGIRLFPARTLWGKKKSKVEASKWLSVPLEEKPLIARALSLFDQAADNLVFMIDQSSRETSIEFWLHDGSSKPRFILFPSKDLDKCPTLLQALAIEFGHVIHFALAKKSDTSLSERMQVDAYPAVRMLTSTDDGQTGIIPYESAINFNAIARFLDSSTRVVPKRMKSRDEL